MTVTTLERIEQAIPDFAIGCEAPKCLAAATRVVHKACGCINFWCAPCVDHYLAMMSEWLPVTISCVADESWRRYCTKISEFVVSVQPI